MHRTGETMKKPYILLVCKDLEGVVPNEIQVIPAGHHTTPKGDFLCDEESAALVLNAFAGRQNDMVVDYEHQTLEGCEAPAAGWIKSVKGLVNKGSEGIWAVGVEWTDRAKQYIANREYRYLSPVFLVRKTDRRVTELVNVALTNQPNIDGMVPLINKATQHLQTQCEEEETMKKLFALLGLSETATEADAITAVNKLLQSGVLVNKVLTILGLAADATEDATTAAIASLKDQAAIMANKDVLTALGLKDGATASEATATILAMKQGDTQTAQLALEVKALKDQLAKKDAGDLVAMAMKDGKIAPAQKDWAEGYAARDPEGFKVFVAKAPVVVPLGTKVTGDGDSPERVEETQLQVNKMLGIEDETYKKHNPPQK
jgi:phage I-like protein